MRLRFMSGLGSRVRAERTRRPVAAQREPRTLRPNGTAAAALASDELRRSPVRNAQLLHPVAKRAGIDAEESGRAVGALNLPACHRQHTLDVRSNDVIEPQRPVTLRSAGSRPVRARAENDGVRAE